jgi:acyl carrier protein
MRPLTENEAYEVVRKAIEELNAERKPQPEISTDMEARLFGQGAALDSLGLVTLLLSVEDRLAASHDLALTLADERAMSEKRSPFRTISALVQYIVKRAAEHDAQ